LGNYGHELSVGWSSVMATMIVIDGSYWELFLVQQISRREMILGDQIQNMLAQFNFTVIWPRGIVYKVILFAQRKRVIFLKVFHNMYYRSRASPNTITSWANMKVVTIP
jgi:hypothetical protein